MGDQRPSSVRKTDAILKHTDHKWVIGHERILRAIKRHAPDEAERAMIEHIDTLIADVHRYRDTFGESRVAAGRLTSTPGRSTT